MMLQEAINRDVKLFEVEWCDLSEKRKEFMLQSPDNPKRWIIKLVSKTKGLQVSEGERSEKGIKIILEIDKGFTGIVAKFSFSAITMDLKEIPNN